MILFFKFVLNELICLKDLGKKGSINSNMEGYISTEA